MEKELVVLLLCCAGALIAEGLPAQEQQVALEAVEKELGIVKPSEVGFPTETVADEQGEDFPSDGEESAEEEGYSKSGAVYTRWGKTTCPSTARLVYFGVAAGAHYTHPGTAANYICLPHNPEYYSSGPPSRYTAYVYGAEYETWRSPLQRVHNHNVPCAVCEARKQTMLMIPAKINCPRQWTREYNGWLMASYYAHKSPKMFVCMDKNPDMQRGEQGNHDGALFYHARTNTCRGLHCPPYNMRKDLACVVCTK